MADEQRRMKTAEQIAEKLWKKHHLKVGPDSWEVIDKEVLLLILHEYGAAVRQRAAGVCRDMHGGWVSDDHLDCAAAIERMELP